MRIAVDAMGGDYGPKVTVEGAARAAADFGIEVLLVGQREKIETVLNQLPTNLSQNYKIKIVDAPEAIGMGEGLFSFYRKRRSSLQVGAQLVKEGRADALVSMGNTAAVVYISQKIFGPLYGIDKPALALLVPTLQGSTLLIDVGASVNCRPHHLVQFAFMGKIFMESVMGIDNPRIALMSIGEEEVKGNDITREAFERLAKLPLNFIGNVEGRDIYSGKAEVIVSDGFTGNVALKVSEGVVETLLSLAKKEVTKNFLAKIGLFLMKKHLKKIYRQIDYSEYGGAHLLGIKGTCVVGHGRSNCQAVRNAIRMAVETVRNKVQEKIQAELLRMEGIIYDLKL
ncbi:MAG: phosphate acyltransferase PlsX [Candidatus Aminicenantes bacterium]|nr:phosphate acyltransferase PlsX [Candidatus Aminicenantes bacterium]